MDITIYLPDELAQRAKARSDINLSRMLRDALTAQFEEEDTVNKTLEGAKPVALALEDKDGHTFLGRIVGAKIADSEDPEVFLTDQQNVVVYEPNKLRYTVCEDPAEELRNWLRPFDYVQAMDALGLEATVDLDI